MHFDYKANQNSEYDDRPHAGVVVQAVNDLEYLLSLEASEQLGLLMEDGSDGVVELFTLVGGYVDMGLSKWARVEYRLITKKWFRRHLDAAAPLLSVQEMEQHVGWQRVRACALARLEERAITTAWYIPIWLLSFVETTHNRPRGECLNRFLQQKQAVSK